MFNILRARLFTVVFCLVVNAVMFILISKLTPSVICQISNGSENITINLCRNFICSTEVVGGRVFFPDAHQREFDYKVIDGYINDLISNGAEITCLDIESGRSPGTVAIMNFSLTQVDKN